jgi:hypothetical protein
MICKRELQTMPKYVLIAAALAALWWFTSGHELDAVPLPDGTLDFPGYTFSNPERFELDARVLSVRDYRSGREAALSPRDLALGWDRMMEDAVVDQISISQSGRWYRWRTESYPIPRREIEISSANMHMVPANETVARELNEIKADDRIRIVGQLVDISAADGWRWRSSRTRADTGNGACELVLLEALYWL